MATSAIRFGDNSIFVRDSELREFIKAVACKLSAEAASKAKDIDWLIGVCACWVDDHENMPPGLRDIELDDALATAGRMSSFKDYLNCLATAESADEAYDAEVARAVVIKILTELLPR